MAKHYSAEAADHEAMWHHPVVHRGAGDNTRIRTQNYDFVADYIH